MSQTCLFEVPAERRHDYPATRTEVTRRMPAEQWREMFAKELEDLERLRPKTRGECHSARAALYASLPDDDPVRAAAPCPWVRCRYNLLVDVEPVNEVQEDTMFGEGEVVETYKIKVHESAPFQHTCVLDAVDDLHAQVDEEDVFDEWGDRAPRETRTGLMTDTEIAERLNISDEEVRKIHNKGLPKMRRRLEIWRNE
jgi:hypothetical protein